MDGSGFDDVLVSGSDAVWLVLSIGSGTAGDSPLLVAGNHGDDIDVASGQGWGDALAGLGQLSAGNAETTVAVGMTAYSPASSSFLGGVALLTVTYDGDVNVERYSIVAQGMAGFTGLDYGSGAVTSPSFGASVAGMPADLTDGSCSGLCATIVAIGAPDFEVDSEGAVGCIFFV